VGRLDSDSLPLNLAQRTRPRTAAETAAAETASGGEVMGHECVAGGILLPSLDSPDNSRVKSALMSVKRWSEALVLQMAHSETPPRLGGLLVL
jgi:hypothetical protein